MLNHAVTRLPLTFRISSVVLRNLILHDHLHTTKKSCSSKGLTNARIQIIKSSDSPGRVQQGSEELALNAFSGALRPLLICMLFIDTSSVFFSLKDSLNLAAVPPLGNLHASSCQE